MLVGLATIAALVFLRRGCATPQKINFLLRPVEAPEIFTPVLKRTQLSYTHTTGIRQNIGENKVAIL